MAILAVWYLWFKGTKFIMEIRPCDVRLSCPPLPPRDATETTTMGFQWNPNSYLLILLIVVIVRGNSQKQSQSLHYSKLKLREKVKL